MPPPARLPKLAWVRSCTIRAGVFEQLPVDDESVDVVISNGVVNLAPDKSQVFAEIHRVLRPGGRLYSPTWWFSAN